MGLLVTAFCLLWFDRGGLRDNIDGHLSFADVLYFTMITVTTVGSATSCRSANAHGWWTRSPRPDPSLHLAHIPRNGGRPRIQTQLGALANEANSEQPVRSCGGRRLRSNRKQSGPPLIAEGLEAERIVAIDCSEEACAAARAMGAAAVQGDASDNDVLAAVHVERASALITSAGRDDTSILIILTARSLAPKLPISVSINAEDNEDIARHAGASTVINPITVSARMLAEATRTIAPVPA